MRAVRVLAHLDAEVAHLVLHCAQGGAQLRVGIGQALPLGDARLEVRGQRGGARVHRQRPGRDVGPLLAPAHVHRRARRVAARVVAAVHRGAQPRGGVLDLHAVGGGAHLRPPRVQPRAQLDRRARVVEQPRARLQRRAAEAAAHPGGALPGQHRVGAAQRIGDAHDVAHAHVVDQQQRGHRAVGKVLVEALLATRQRHARRVQPVAPAPVAADFHVVQRECLGIGQEADLEAPGLAQQRGRARLEDVVDELVLGAAAAVDLVVVEPEAPARVVGAGRLRRPLRLDALQLRERGHRPGLEAVFTAREFLGAQLRACRQRQQRQPSRLRHGSPSGTPPEGGLSTPSGVRQARAASAATAGSSLPSRNSRKAPPPVEM